MSDTARATFVDRLFDRERLQRIADGLAVAVAVALPWSVTASITLIVVWLVVLLSTIDPAALRRTIVLPAAGLPVVLCMLASFGIAWSEGLLADQFGSFKVFLRLTVIVLLLVQFQRSDRGMWVLGGFLASCTVLLVVSWAQWMVPALDWRGVIPGVPVKDYIVQGGEFLICAFALLHLSLSTWNRGRRVLAAAFGLLALLFLANIAFVAAARSVLLIFAVLVIVFGLQRFGARGALAIAILAAVFSATIWMSSPYLRSRILNVVQEVQDYRTKHAESSSGYRLEFWRRSIAIISDAPVFGHGTGSVWEQFSRIAEGTNTMSAVVTDNPHNQTLIVGIQLGLVGVALLYAMWIAHLSLFRGNELVAWVGVGVVVHNIGAGVFNSQLFEATLGWVYIFGVGVLGGMVLRARRQDSRPDALTRP